MGLVESCRRYLSTYPDTPAIAVAEVWHDRRELINVADRINEILDREGIEEGAGIGFIARNRLPHIGALFGMLAGSRTIIMFLAYQPAGPLSEEILLEKPSVIIADRSDWAEEPIREAARRLGAVGIQLDADADEPVQLVSGLEKRGVGPFRPPSPGVAIAMLTSGTTGAPKRIPIGYATLEQAMHDAGVIQSTGTTAPGSTPFIQFFGLGNISGLWGLLQSVSSQKPIVLFEKFTVRDWTEAVRRYRLTSASLPPTAVQMILDANVPPDYLSSLEMITCGAGILPADVQADFERIYGAAILPQYGATEFCGVVAGWTLDLHRKFIATKRGSTGIARPGIGLRIVEAETGAELPHGERGVLEILVPRISDQWIRTTDVGSMDEDGFLYIYGRADAVINRGGFKVAPEKVADTLRRHPLVAEACVLGLPDKRLGEVPIAAVEFLSPNERVTEEELLDFAREHLSSFEVPKRVFMFDELPRTRSLKVQRGELRDLLTQRMLENA